MSNDKNANEELDTASNAKDNLVSKVMGIKESNPKVFFGAIAALVLIVLAMMMVGGGSNKRLPVAKAVNLEIGQSYVLKGVNTYDPAATVRLVAVPGSMAAYDDTEEADRKGKCQHMPQGTKVKLVQIQEAIGKARFVQVEMTEGECRGKKGWTVSNNLN